MPCHSLAKCVHVMSHESERVIPLLVGDECFLRSIDETVLQTCLVMRLYPYKCFMACAVPKKGFDELVIRRLVKFLRDMGLIQLPTGMTESMP